MNPVCAKGFFQFSLGLLGLVVVSACSDEPGPLPTGGNPPEDVSIYDDVTQTNLPFNALTGLSMDGAIADLDADGDLDIMIANEFLPNILLVNNGSGVFANVSSRLPAANHDSEDIGIADFDGDTDLDIIVVSEDDRVNEFYLNDGTGRFSDASSRIPVTGISNGVVVANLGGDPSPDIVLGNNGQNRILINDGNANFTDETALRLPTIDDATQDVELGDVDNDGDLDLLLGNEDRNRLLINDGNGIFTDESDARIPERTAPEETREADFGDIDDDGDLDILFANVNSTLDFADPTNRLLVNDGNGFYQDVTSAQLPANSDRSFEGDFVDVDGDGDLDIMTGNLNANAPNFDSPYRVYLNDGTGHFTDGTSATLPVSAVGRGFDVEAADFNGDGVIDLFLASRGTTDRLLFGR